MTVDQVFQLVDDARAAMKAHGVIGPDGNFAKHPALIEAEDLIPVASVIEGDLKADGVPVPANLDKALQALPGIIGLLGTVLS